MKGKLYKVSAIRDWENLSTCTPSPTEMRLTAAVGAVARKEQSIADWAQAYLPAKPGDPSEAPAYACPPVDLWPESWVKQFSHLMNVKDPRERPICLLLGSAYGRDRAGHDYDKHANEVVTGCGYSFDKDVAPCVYVKPIPDEFVDKVREQDKLAGVPLDSTGLPNRHYVPDSLCRYTDDNLGNNSTFTNAVNWEQLGARMRQERVDPLDGRKYVGMNYRISHFKEKGYCEIGFDQRAYLKMLVQEFQVELKETQERELRRRFYPLPVVEKQFHREESAASCEREAAAHAALPAGVWKERCRHYIGGLLYVNQCSRPDVSFAVSHLSSFQDKWSIQNDSELEWLMGYLMYTSGYVLKGRLYYADLYSWCVVLKTDGSHAACKSSRKGTSGFAIFLVGPAGSRLLLSWGTKKQTAIALSSGECELFAMLHGSRTHIRCVMLLNFLLGFNPLELRFDELLESDSSVALSILARGSSASLRHLRRSAGVSVAWLHEYWCADDRCSDPSQKREPGSGARRTKHQSGLDLEPDCLTKALGKDQTDRYNASFGLAEEAEGETE